MGHWEREEATIVLPAQAVAPLKAILRQEHNALRQRILDTCKAVWLEELKKTRSSELYQQRLDAWETSIYERQRTNTWSKSSLNEHEQQYIFEMVRSLLSRLVDNPRQIQIADLERGSLRKATSRTTGFDIGFHGECRIEGRTLYYTVYEERHSIEPTHNHPLGKALFHFLDNLDWTRGTGGLLVGNNEYAQENGRGQIGSGGDYMTAWWGPLGNRQAKESRQLVQDYNPKTCRSSRDRRHSRSW